MVWVRNSDPHSIKSAYLVLQLLEGMDFVVFIRHYWSSAKYWHTIGPERLVG